MFDLTGKCALITGASGGIGAAIARTLHGAGATVALSGTREGPLTELAAELGARAHVLPCDLSDPAAVDALPKAAAEAMGGLEILVNNAGASAAGDFAELTDAQWDASFAVKFHGAVRMCRAALPALEASGRGVIVTNIGAAWKQPKPAFLVGASINAALANFTKGLAQLGTERGVRVVSISSGPVRTERLEASLRDAAAAAGRTVDEIAAERARALGMTRYATPQDLADMACFLASDRAGHVHGANLFIDGGQTREL
jgi:NAD(P)-dependent dehydrogenase (short-subunit alcohol dehydrogenase family)